MEKVRDREPSPDSGNKARAPGRNHQAKRQRDAIPPDSLAARLAKRIEPELLVDAVARSRRRRPADGQVERSVIGKAPRTV